MRTSGSSSTTSTVDFGLSDTLFAPSATDEALRLTYLRTTCVDPNQSMQRQRMGQKVAAEAGRFLLSFGVTDFSYRRDGTGVNRAATCSGIEFDSASR